MLLTYVGCGRLAVFRWIPSVSLSHTVFACNLWTTHQVWITGSISLFVNIWLITIFCVLSYTFRPRIRVFPIESIGLFQVRWYHLPVVSVKFNGFSNNTLFHILNNLIVEIEVPVFLLIVGNSLFNFSSWSLFAFALLFLFQFCIVRILVNIYCFFGMTAYVRKLSTRFPLVHCISIIDRR